MTTKKLLNILKTQGFEFRDTLANDDSLTEKELVESAQESLDSLIKNVLYSDRWEPVRVIQTPFYPWNKEDFTPKEYLLVKLLDGPNTGKTVATYHFILDQACFCSKDISERVIKRRQEDIERLQRLAACVDSGIIYEAEDHGRSTAGEVGREHDEKMAKTAKSHDADLDKGAKSLGITLNRI